MINLDLSLTFFGMAVLLSATPGPDNLFVLMQSATSGRRAGFSVVLGLCTGLMLHTLAVALGLAALFAASALAFAALKIAGCAYLLYLAWGAWHAPAAAAAPAGAPSPSTSTSTSTGSSAAAAPPGRMRPISWPMYGRGIMMNASNPKVVFFFLALLPQFVRPGAGPVALQIACLGALFIAATLLVFGAIVLAAGTLRARLLRSGPAQRLLNRATALVFAALAARLALAQR